ncbi:MAG: YybH family protein [Labedaea sp.]
MPANHPEELHELFVAAVNHHDLDALVALYEPDAVGVDLEGKPVAGAAALRKFLGGFLSRVQSMAGDTRRAHRNGDLALLSSSWRATLAAGPGGGPFTVEGTSAEIARRQPDGTWRLFIDDPAFTA